MYILKKHVFGYLPICTSKIIFVNRRYTLSLDKNQNLKDFKLGTTTIKETDLFSDEYKYRGYFELLTNYSSNNKSVI